MSKLLSDTSLTPTCNPLPPFETVETLTVIDCDPGTDDAAALFLLSRLKRFPDACVATYGNRPQSDVLRNLRALVSYLGESPALFNGATAPLTGTPPSCGDFHGVDGLGGLAASLPSRCPPGRSAPAQIGSLEALGTKLLSAREVTYIATAPLTTLATLIDREPHVKDHIRHLEVMGGGLRAFNMPHRTEYNFAADPAAVRKVLASGLPITLFPLDLTHREALLHADVLAELAATKRDPEILQLVECNRASNVATGQSQDAAVLHDVLPCLHAIHPEYFTLQEMHLTADPWGHLEASPDGYPVQVATQVAPGVLLSAFRQALSVPTA